MRVNTKRPSHLRATMSMSLYSAISFAARVPTCEIDDGLLAAIDQMMAVSLAGGKARGKSGLEDLLALIGDKRHLPFEHENELVLLVVPMSLRGPGAGASVTRLTPN